MHDVANPSVSSSLRHVRTADLFIPPAILRSLKAQTAVLDIAEDRSIPRRPVVTIRAGGADAPSLVVTLDESVICARRDAGGLRCETEYRLRPDRSDDETAAYVLQHWMEHL